MVKTIKHQKYKCIEPYTGELILNKIYLEAKKSNGSWVCVNNELGKIGTYYKKRFIKIKDIQIHEIW